eukprot:7399989-Alexandrium_andersonii.AAC.1
MAMSITRCTSLQRTFPDELPSPSWQPPSTGASCATEALDAPRGGSRNVLIHLPRSRMST